MKLAISQHILQRLRRLEREVELLRREVFRSYASPTKTTSRSLFGSIRGGDITEGMVEEAKKSLFRDLSDITS